MLTTNLTGFAPAAAVRVIADDVAKAQPGVSPGAPCSRCEGATRKRGMFAWCDRCGSADTTMTRYHEQAARIAADPLAEIETLAKHLREASEAGPLTVAVATGKRACNADGPGSFTSPAQDPGGTARLGRVARGRTRPETARAGRPEAEAAAVVTKAERDLDDLAEVLRVESGYSLTREGAYLAALRDRRSRPITKAMERERVAKASGARPASRESAPPPVSDEAARGSLWRAVEAANAAARRRTAA